MTCPPKLRIGGVRHLVRLPWLHPYGQTPSNSRLDVDLEQEGIGGYTCPGRVLVGPWLVSVGDSTRTRLMTSV